MTEVAALQMNVESSSVLRAANDLDKFSAAAKRAGAAAGLHSGSIGKIVAAMQSMDAKLGAIVSSLDRMAKSSQGVAAANDNVARAIGVADSHVIAYTQHLAALAAQQQQANAHVIAWRQSLANQASATADSNAHIIAYRNSLGQVEESAKKVSAAIKFTAQDGLNASRQLADIGVTAAMGMSPFMIAIQQGPQLLDILQNKAAVTGQTLGAVFRAAALEVGAFLLPFAPLIAAVGLLAAGIAALTSQANDDSGLRKYTTAMGYTKEEVKKLNAVTVTWGDTFKAVFQVGFERIASTLGVSANSIKDAWNSMLDALATGTRATIATLYAGFTGLGYQAKRVFDNIKAGKIENPLTTALESWKTAYGDAQKFMDDTVKQARSNAQKRQAEMAKGFYDKPSTPKGPHQYNFSDLLKEAQKMENSLDKAGAQIGLYGEDLARVTYQQDLLNKASEHGLKLTPKQIAQVNELAAAMAKLSEDNRHKQFMEDFSQQTIQQIATLETARGAIGLSGAALAEYTYKQERLNKALADHITLTDADRAKIDSDAADIGEKTYKVTRDTAVDDNRRSHAEAMRQLDAERGALLLNGQALIAYNYAQQLKNAELQKGIQFADLDTDKINKQAAAYATARYAIDQQAQAIADAREVAKGFAVDLIGSLREGGNAFAAFADAATNALNRIIDKLLDRTLDNFLNGLFGGSSSSALSSTSISGAGSFDFSSFAFANGGAFGTAQRFANGGAFTNSIVSSPTLFKFANGGALGEMGEAGPEAIMPLARNSQGKLGVHVSGGGAKSQAPTSIIIQTPINMTQSGSFTTQDAQAMGQQAAQAAVDHIRRNFQSIAAEWQHDGGVST